MTEASRHDGWQTGDRYEAYMGRWSCRIAPRFLDCLGASRDLNWLDVGCGTGARSAAILARAIAGAWPRSILPEGSSTARASVAARRAEFQVGDAQALAFEAASRDVVASALQRPSILAR